MQVKASISTKINSIIIISLLLLGGASIFISGHTIKKKSEREIEGYRQTMMEEKRSHLKSLIEVAYHIAKHNYDESLGGNEEDAIARTLATINSLRYGDDGAGYFYTLDTRTRRLVQHPKQALIGRPDTSFKDAEGKRQVVALIDIALKNNEGYEEYKWEKLGETLPQPKLSFVKHFSEWGLAIVTGTYIDDVNKAIAIKEAEIKETIRSETISQAAIIFGIMVLTVLVAYPIVSVGIVKPIRNIILMLKDIAQGDGDLTKRITDKSGDETEEMAYWFNTFVAQVQDIIKDASGNAAQLTGSSATLAQVSNEMAAASDHTSSASANVAAASEEMSANMNSVAAAMEEASTNVSMVASATEEVSSTINGIASNTTQAREIASSAVTRTASASEQVSELGQAARDIGKVVETITEISSQVDLLALNATIEAARAGEAGKGFAVVAGEIKELARQTAEASGEIKDRVVGIQSSTEGTVREINEVSGVVDEIDKIVTNIAVAVEEQSMTTDEIVNNVSQASLGLSEVNENVAQSSQVSNEIAQDIGHVTDAAADVSRRCADINDSSKELAGLAEQLNTMVGRFKV